MPKGPLFICLKGGDLVSFSQPYDEISNRGYFFLAFFFAGAFFLALDFFAFFAFFFAAISSS